MDQYPIQERKSIRTTKTGLSDDLVGAIESCLPLPLDYDNVCVDGRNGIFMQPSAWNVCQRIMSKSWRKVSFREKENKKEKPFQNRFPLILICYHKPKLEAICVSFVCLLYQVFFFFNQVHVLKVTTCNTKVHLSLSAIRQHERAEVLLLILTVAIKNTFRFRVALILIVAMKNTICFKLETSGRSIKSGQALTQNGPILTLHEVIKVFSTTQQFHVVLCGGALRFSIPFQCKQFNTEVVAVRELRFTKFSFKLKEERFAALVGQRKFDILFIVFSPYQYKQDNVHFSFPKDNCQSEVH